MQTAFSVGADNQAMPTDTGIRIAVNSSDCHKKTVSVNGITPVIASSAGGMLAGLACRSAAEEDRPSAHTELAPM